MKDALLGAKWSLSAEPTDHTVVPGTALPSSSVHVNAVPPHSWTSIPRCRLYQACSAGASLALKKMPPMPVTRFIEPPRSGSSETSCVFFGLTLRFGGSAQRRQAQPAVRRRDRSMGALRGDRRPALTGQLMSGPWRTEIVLVALCCTFTVR